MDSDDGEYYDGSDDDFDYDYGHHMALGFLGSPDDDVSENGSDFTMESDMEVDSASDSRESEDPDSDVQEISDAEEPPDSPEVVPEPPLSPLLNGRRSRRLNNARNQEAAAREMQNEDGSDTDFEDNNDQPLNENQVEILDVQVVDLVDGPRANEALIPVVQDIQRNEIVETVEVVSIDGAPSAVSPRTPKSTKGKKRQSKDRSDTPINNMEEDDGMTCSVCLDFFTNSGPHRLVSLRCGHLFGHSCVERWLKTGCTSGARRCPNCNKKAKLSDIRIIYARKLQAVDTTEKERIQYELDKTRIEKSKLEQELAKSKINFDLQERRIQGLVERIKVLEKKEREAQEVQSVLSLDDQRRVDFPLIHNVEINRGGGCRVLAYSQNIGLMVVSQVSTNSMFPGYGIRKLDGIDFRPTQFIHLHSKAIRDISFHPTDGNLMLSVALDKTAKLMDNVSNSVVGVYPADQFLWSCCWNTTNPHELLTGSQNGVVTMYDRRYANEPVKIWTTYGDTTPVVSLASVPPSRNSVLADGGFISCRLNSVYMYENYNAGRATGPGDKGRVVMTDGPFVSMSYNPKSQFILATCRPNVRMPNVRHITSQLSTSRDKNMCNHIHTFHCGTSARVMSRSSQLLMPNGDTFVAAYNESKTGVELLSVNRGHVLCNVRIQDTVVDMCPLQCSDTSTFLASLTDKNLFVNKIIV